MYAGHPRRIALLVSPEWKITRGILKGIADYAASDKNWLFLWIRDPHQISLLKDWRPSGIIAHINQSDMIDAVRALRRPVVNTSATLCHLGFPRVGLDEFAIAEMVAEYFVQRGLGSFTYMGYPGHTYSDRREQAFYRALSRYGYAPSRSSTIFPASLRLNGVGIDETIRRTLQALPLPAGVMACNDMMASWILDACRQLELRVPDDVAVVGVDNDELICELSYPRLSSVAVPSEQIGWNAAELLEKLMNGDPTPDRPCLLPPIGIVTRQSSNLELMSDAPSP